MTQRALRGKSAEFGIVRLATADRTPLGLASKATNSLRPYDRSEPVAVVRFRDLTPALVPTHLLVGPVSLDGAEGLTINAVVRNRQVERTINYCPLATSLTMHLTIFILADALVPLFETFEFRN